MAGEKDYIMKAIAILEATEKLKSYNISVEAWSILERLREEAAAEIRREEAKNGGKLNRTKAAERVIKNAKSYQAARECFHGAWNNANGLQCICDGFQAYRLREALPLEPIPEKTEPIDVNCIVTPNQGEPLKLPELSELRAYIKTKKAELKAKKDKSIVIYDFGEGLPAVNAEYLLTALELLPGCTATTSKLRPLTNCIYFESSSGDGVICPIRKGANV